MSERIFSDAEILAAVKVAGSQRKAAAALGINRRTLERRLERMSRPVPDSRLLVIDIETRPLLGYVWGTFNQNLGPSQVVDWGGMMCFAAKWDGDDDVMFYAEWERGGKDRMLRAALRLLDEADGVVGWNSARFDVRWIKGELHRYGMRKPTPFKSIDLMREQKREMFLYSNKLESRRRWLGKEGKVDTGGFGLWRGCMDGDRESRALMEEYNRADVLITQEEFDTMRQGGWLKSLPNASLHGGHCCPACGSERLQAHKPYEAQTRRYALWVCQDCGTASRSTKAEPGGAQMRVAA